MSDRRRYPRVQADVFWRPAGSPAFHHKRNTQDISLGGARVRSDQSVSVGTRLDLEVLLPDGTSVRCWAEVAWVVELGRAAGTGYDIGLRFTDLAPSDLQRLASVLVSA
jgi:c-di-GMP-binding flagellar brake protein YcgR